MKILILNPPALKIVEPYYDRPDFPRTALAFLAGHLRKKLIEDSIKVLDAKFERYDLGETLDYIKKENFDLVGITAMTNEIKTAAEVASLVKKYNANIQTVIGGVHVTALPEETLREYTSFDFAVVGEGEEVFLNLINELKNKREPFVNGVAYLKNDEYKFKAKGSALADQDSLEPAWDLFRPAAEYMLQSSRGCPFACNFCMNPGGRVVRPRSVETTLNEIGYLLDNMKPKSIYFGDEIFTIKKQRIMELCQGMIDRGYNKRVQWWCQTHVNTLDRDLVKIMKQAGCKLVGLGIETGNEETFKNMGKGINKDKINKTVKILKEEKLNFDCMFILGQPNETIESAKRTIDFAIELNPTFPIFGLMVPYPGTKIGEMAMVGTGGYNLLTKDWDQFNKQIGNALDLKDISRKDLERIQLLGYIKVFLYNFRFLDFFKFALKYRQEGFEVLKKIAFSR